ncbi:MAG: hypothetical protein DCC71_06810 [Proteobacteria bacterium]|nr:MAG: hypothetical protein DCC71_06810 [Pseudomonadota bacterium]
MSIDSTALTELPPRKAIVLDNENCPYCGAQLVEGSWNKEHAIGRRFVPRGKFADSWNLILRACITCNSRKADLEDDLSAITMQPDPTGEFADPDPVLREEAMRKAAGSINRRTGTTVGESAHTMTIALAPMPGVNASFTLNGPPQPDPDRVFELARMHAQALFYRVTYDASTRRGGFFLGDVYTISYCLRGDWGNAMHRAFMHGVSGWEPRCVAIAADRFFKAVIRRHPEATCWSWAVEWNHNLRVIGFAGDRAPIDAIFAASPPAESRIVGRGADGSILRLRVEVPLEAHEDVLFEA